MANFIQNFNLAYLFICFILLLAILVAFLLFHFRTFISGSINDLRKQMSSVKGNISTGSETHFRNDVYRFAQKQHLTASLFSLDEIAIVPRVLTPLVQATPSVEMAPTDSVSLSVPYIPDWPEFAAVYQASTMTLVEALQGGASIILAGLPGSGKTVALAWLASILAREAPDLGVLTGLLPLYIHVTDLHHLYSRRSEHSAPSGDEGISETSAETTSHQKQALRIGDAAEVLIDALSNHASPLTIPRLSGVVRSALDNNQAILLLDRVDELPADQAESITDYLTILHEKYPNLRMIVAMSYDNLAGLPALGLRLLGMAFWGGFEKSIFLKRWSQLWSKWVSPTEKTQSRKINTYYLKSWLSSDNSRLSPLEYTLKVWAAYCGDILGTDGPSAIEAYIRRMTSNVSKARPGLEQFAMQMLFDNGITSNPYESGRFFKELEAEVKQGATENAPGSSEAPESPSIKPPVRKELSGIDILSNNGFLISHSGSQYSFSHPVFCGYLAGNALSTSGMIQRIQSQPAWNGKTLAMYYLARAGDVTSLIQQLLQEDDIVHTNHLMISRWLHVAPKNRPWRSIILRTLVTVLQKEKDTVSLASKIIAGLSLSGDSGVSIYFRQLLKSDNPNLRQLAALGCGILAEKKAIEDLNSMLQEPSPIMIRSACLALAAIGDKQCLEILATSLLNGNEDLRRYAAEALANNPVEGHPALKEGSTMEDLLVRRSVAFGLIRVNQPWAIKIVENMQLEDSEWVVRNAAIQAFDELRRKSNYAPHPLPDLTETQWLIDYATKLGTTVAPGKPAEDLVIKALTSGKPNEQLNAVEYLRNKCDVHSIEKIHAVYLNSSGELRDAVYYILWLMTISGIKLPTSVKYNL